MDALMEEIKDIFRLKTNQGLTLEQQMAQVRVLVAADKKETINLYYKTGMKDAMGLISENIETKFGQL